MRPNKSLTLFMQAPYHSLSHSDTHLFMIRYKNLTNENSSNSLTCDNVIYIYLFVLNCVVMFISDAVCE